MRADIVIPLAAILVSCGMTAAVAQEVVSEMPKIMAAAATTLPEGPGPSQQDDNCSHHIVDPKTEAGRYVQKRGWGVVSEVEAGDYHLVSFAGEFIPGTSGSCAIQQGNVGVFEQSELKAILYTASKTDRIIGTLEPLENGNLRIWGSDYLGLPVADIVAGSFGLIVREVANEDAFCGGKLAVPNIYDLAITDARKALQNAGWEPVDQPREEWGQQADLQDLGIAEAATCSGTGFGFCSYAYRQHGTNLDVTTAGELFEDAVPRVTDYAVECQH